MPKGALPYRGVVARVGNVNFRVLNRRRLECQSSKIGDWHSAYPVLLQSKFLYL